MHPIPSRSGASARPGIMRVRPLVIAATALVVAANAGPSGTNAPGTVQQVAAEDR